MIKAKSNALLYSIIDEDGVEAGGQAEAEVFSPSPLG
jgi:hypothetical protein